MSSRREFADEYLHVLKSIEERVVEAYKQDPNLTDFSVANVYKALLPAYGAEVRSFQRSPRLTDKEKDLLTTLSEQFDWWLGKGDAQPDERLTEQEVRDCIKYLLRSVDFWNKDSGRQGYLNYISSFFE